jgi:hypothetical protein
MGGDDSQKLLPWRGIHSPPGRKPPAQLRINTLTQTGSSDFGVSDFLPVRSVRTEDHAGPCHGW